MRKIRMVTKPLSLLLAVLLTLAFVVPASAMYIDDGETIKFYTGSGIGEGDDTLKYKSLMYAQYADALGSGDAAPAVTPDGTLAEGWTGQLVDNGDGSALKLQAALTPDPVTGIAQAQWIWSTQKVETGGDLIAGGTGDPTKTGDIVRFDRTFNVDGTPTDEPVLYITADNAFIVFINDTLVDFSSSLFYQEDRATVKANIEAAVAGPDGIDGIVSLFPDLSESRVQTNNWQTSKSVAIPVDPALLLPGNNTITVIGFNEMMTPADNNGQDGSQYHNPAGIVFMLEVPYTKTVANAAFSVAKYDVRGVLLTDEVFHFVAYTELTPKGDPVPASKVAESDTEYGIAAFEDMAPGTYYIFEELSDVRGQNQRFKPRNPHGDNPVRYLPFIIVTVPAGAEGNIGTFDFQNDYNRTPVPITKDVGFAPETTELSLAENYKTDPDAWQNIYRIAKSSFEADINFDVDVILCDAIGDIFSIGTLNLYTKDDGGLYGKFEPEDFSPAIVAGAMLTVETDAYTASSDEMIAGTEFLVADSTDIDALFEEDDEYAYITLFAEIDSLDIITLPSTETFYLKIKGPAIDPVRFPDGQIIEITPGTPVNLALFWGDYTIEEVDEHGNPITGYKVRIKASVSSQTIGGGYGPPVITYDGTFTILHKCDIVSIEVLNTPIPPVKGSHITYVAKYNTETDALVTDEVFEFWLYKKSQYDELTDTFTGDPIAKAFTEFGIAVFHENNGTPDFKDDDFVLDPAEEYVVLEVLTPAQQAKWTYGPQGRVMPIQIYEVMPDVLTDNKFYNTPKEILGSISGIKYQRFCRANCDIVEYEDIPLKGYPIYLFDEDGNLVDSTTTGSDGKFIFENLPLGTYIVREPTNEYWKVVDGYTDSVTVTLTETDPDYTGIVFKNYLKNVCIEAYTGYGPSARHVYTGDWFTYVTLPSGTESMTYDLRRFDPLDPDEALKVGEFTATRDGDYLKVKIDLDILGKNISHGLIDGLPEINVGVGTGTNFFAGWLKNNSNLNSTKYRDAVDPTLFVIPLSELKAISNIAAPINIFVNGVVVLAPEGYADFPTLP